jgi:hypothetical protein
LEEAHQTQEVVRLDGRVGIPASGGQGEGTLTGRHGAVILASHKEVSRHKEGDTSQPARIVQGFRQRFGGAEVVEVALMLPKDTACTTQVKPQIDGLLL